MYTGFSIAPTADSSHQKLTPQNSEMTHSKFGVEGKEKTANQNFSIQETYNSKNEEEMKTYPDKQKWRELVGSRPALQGILKGVHQAGREGQYVSVIMWIGQEPQEYQPR